MNDFSNLEKIKKSGEMLQLRENPLAQTQTLFREAPHSNHKRGQRSIRITSLSSDGRVPVPEELSVSQHTSGTKMAEYNMYDIP